MMPPLAPSAYTIQRVRRGKRAAGLDAEARALLEYADFPIGCHQRVHAVALCENSVVGAVVVQGQRKRLARLVAVAGRRAGRVHGVCVLV